MTRDNLLYNTLDVVCQ